MISSLISLNLGLLNLLPIPVLDGGHIFIMALEGLARRDFSLRLKEKMLFAGFVVLIPMLRGENGLPGSYSMFYDEVDDVLAAAEVLALTPGVDANRLYVAGHSVGGTLTMLAAMGPINP